MNKPKKPFKIVVLVILGLILAIGVFIVGAIYREYNRSFTGHNIYENSKTIYPNMAKVRLRNQHNRKYVIPKLDNIFRKACLFGIVYCNVNISENSKKL